MRLINGILLLNNYFAVKTALNNIKVFFSHNARKNAMVLTLSNVLIGILR